MSGRRALLLVGSPRGMERSTSGRLGKKMLDVLSSRGFTTEARHVHAAVRNTAELQQTLTAVAAADLVVLSLPLYVDSFPAPVIALLEEVARRGIGKGRARFAMIIQCGFPEREQNSTALRIAERFAREAEWTWLGGLAFGGVELHVARAEHAVAAAAEALSAGNPIPEMAPAATMPAWLYRLGGNVMWRRVAAKNGVAGRLRARPYEN